MHNASDTFPRYDFEIIHIPRVLNVLPGYLSFLYPSGNDSEEDNNNYKGQYKLE